MFCQYETLCELAAGSFSTIYKAGEWKLKRSAKEKIAYNNAKVVSTCESLTRIARLTSPPFERLGPFLRMPTPRPKACFIKMSVFLKGLTIVRRQQAIVLHVQCKEVVEAMIIQMEGLNDSDVSIVEIDAVTAPPKKKPRLAIEARKVGPNVDPNVDLNVDDVVVLPQFNNNLRNMAELTMAEPDFPRYQEEAFGDEPILPVEKGYNVGNLSALLENMPPVPHDAVNGVPQTTRVSQQQPIAPLDGVHAQEAPENEGELAEMGRPAVDSLNASSISLLSAQKRKGAEPAKAPPTKRRRLPLKVWLSNFNDLANMQMDPVHRRSLCASESWQDGMGDVHRISIRQRLNLPLLPINDQKHLLFFNLGKNRKGKTNMLRQKFNSPEQQSPGSNEVPLPGQGRRSMLLGSPVDHAAPKRSSLNPRNPSLEGVPEDIAGPSCSKRGMSPVDEEDEEDAKRSRLEKESQLAAHRQWDRALLLARINEMWESEGSPISFYDLCPRGKTSARTAAKVLSALLDLHKMKAVYMEQEVHVLCTPILIYRSDSQGPLY